MAGLITCNNMHIPLVALPNSQIDTQQTPRPLVRPNNGTVLGVPDAYQCWHISSAVRETLESSVVALQKVRSG